MAVPRIAYGSSTSLKECVPGVRSAGIGHRFLCEISGTMHDDDPGLSRRKAVLDSKGPMLLRKAAGNPRGRAMLQRRCRDSPASRRGGGTSKARPIIRRCLVGVSSSRSVSSRDAHKSARTSGYSRLHAIAGLTRRQRLIDSGVHEQVRDGEAVIRSEPK